MVYVLGIDLTVNSGDQVEIVFPFPVKVHRVQLNFGGQYRCDNFTCVKTKGENYYTIQSSSNVAVLMLVKK